MKKRKILSLFLSLCLLIGLLPTVALAADQVADESGVRITEAAYDSANNILTINVDIKIPNSSGIKTVGSIISYDSSKLTLIDGDDDTYTPASPAIDADPAIQVKLIDTAKKAYSTDSGVKLYGDTSRAGLFVGLGSTKDPSNKQKTTDWLTIYQLRFKVSGNAEAILNSDSLRIADPAKDNDVIKGAYPANNKFVISVDSGDSIGYKYGKMQGYTGGDVGGTNWAMNPANVTATYPGSTNPPPAAVGALGGSASISGTAKYDEDLTAETALITGNTGTFSYQWKRSGTDIPSATSSTYKLVEDDIGKTITVAITSSVESGTIVSSATATVEKADGPAAPTSVTPVACTNSSNNDGKLQNVTNAMEYQKSGAGTWTACSGTEVTGLTNGTYYVRVAETTTHKVGAAANVDVPAYTAGALGGSASISGTAKYDEDLTAETALITGNTGTFSYQWKRSGTDIPSATSSTYKLVEDDIGKTITVAITSSVESGTIVSSATATVEKADGPAAPTSVTPVACTNSSNNDGKLQNVTNAMEYQKSGAGTWTACSGTEVTGLTNGTYYVRVAETTTHKVGAAANVDVPAYTAGALGGGSYTPSYSITVDKTENGTITVSPKSASKGDTVTVTVKPDKGYELDTLKVLDKNGDKVKLTEKNGKYTFTMPAGKVTVKGSFVEETPVQIFKDVPVDAYYYEAVKWAAEKGITGGVGNGLFAPNQPCTRAQIVTFLWRAAGSPAPKQMSSFADVPADAFYAKAVAWAVENGITGGTGDGKFSPDATCTRAQAVTFLYRASGAPAVSGNAEFGDVATNAYYADAVAWAAKNGITGGIGGGLFGSGNDCTRAQIVTFLYRSVK